MKKEIPFWEKSNLTVEEAASYFSIGINKIREISDNDNCDFVLWLIKRVKFEKFLENQYSI